MGNCKKKERMGDDCPGCHGTGVDNSFQSLVGSMTWTKDYFANRRCLTCGGTPQKYAARKSARKKKADDSWIKKTGSKKTHTTSSRDSDSGFGIGIHLDQG